MPPSEIVLAQLSAIAEQALPIAVAWHLAVAAALILALKYPRALARLPALLIVALIASVSVVAWWFGNPFNALAFALLTAGLATIAVRTPGELPEGTDRSHRIAGTAMMTFGWLYPHFLAGKSAAVYLVAAPLGLLPCPTLAFAIGLTLFLGRRFSPRAWPILLGVAGAFYGLFGALRLGVQMDLILLLGAAFLLVRSRREKAESR